MTAPVRQCQPMTWEPAETADIEETAFYLVQDNGMEWGDPDLDVMKGWLVRGRLAPQIKRGRPQWIAKIVRPSALPQSSAVAREIS